MPCGSYILIQPVAVMHLFPAHLLDSATAMLEYFSCAWALQQRFATQIFSETTSPLKNWQRPSGRPRATWMQTIQQDLKSNLPD